MKCQDLFSTSTLLLLFSRPSLSTRFNEYILAPSSRSVRAVSLVGTTGSVDNNTALHGNVLDSQGAVFASNSSVTLDFGKNIAGTVEFDVESVLGDNKLIGFSFTESSLWLSPYHCDSGTSATFDSPLWFQISGNGSYAAEKKHQRGGFRYMSIWNNSTGTVTLGNVRVNFTAAPEMEDLQGYKGYFNSDSERLNRVWYAGAYTNQLCSADPAYGNALGIPGTDWYYNATIANGTSVLMDGAKRDRLVWPGDVIISAPSIFVSIGNLDSIKNAIRSLFPLQQPNGRLPWAGVPFTRPGRFQFSFTYHLYTLLDLYTYYIYSGDTGMVETYWEQYKLGISWALSTIDASGMANVTSTNDWLRSGMGGHNVEANAILYHTLDMSLKLADEFGETTLRDTWSTAMDHIKSAVNERLWDPSQNLFFDNDTIQTSSSIHPQDGNSWAVISSIADHERAAAISTSLQRRWVRPYGAPAPEAGATISPFASGFEVQAHFLAGFPERAIDLIEFMWADFMLDDPRMTNSSFIEGYATNGDLHYAPYDNDARVSHAHGWASGPTSALTFLGAGLQLSSASGKTWLIEPRLGTLGHVTAGYETSLGKFSVDWTNDEEKGGLTGCFETPEGTSGTLILPDGSIAIVEGPSGVVQPSNTTIIGGVTYTNLNGGSYTVGVVQ